MTAIAVEPIDDLGGPCTSAGTFEAALNDPPPLVFDEGHSGDGDLDGDGFVENDGVYQVVADDEARHVEIRVGRELIRGLALRALLPAGDGVTVWRDGARLLAGVDYLIQPSDGGVTIFLRGSVTSDVVLRIAAPGGEPR